MRVNVGSGLKTFTFLLLVFLFSFFPARALAGSTTLVQTSADTFITTESPDTPHSTTGYTGAGDWDGHRYRSLYKFDIPNVGSKINTATLRLYVYDGSGEALRRFRVYRLLKPANFANTTWNNYDTGRPWTTPGGLEDVDSERLGESADFPNLYGAWVSIALDSEEMNLIRRGEYPNYGFLVTAAVENTENRSNLVRPWDESNFAPQLVVSYSDTTYQVNFSNGANGTLEGALSQSVLEGASSLPVTAIANAGYRFAGWSDGSIENPRIEENVLKNVTLRANFEKIILPESFPKTLPITGPPLPYALIILLSYLGFVIKK